MLRHIAAADIFAISPPPLLYFSPPDAAMPCCFRCHRERWRRMRDAAALCALQVQRYDVLFIPLFLFDVITPIYFHAAY